MTIKEIRATIEALEAAHAEAQPTAARYMEQVAQADSLKRLWSIYQAATNDDTVSAAQCSTIYRAAALQAGKLDESRGVRL